MPAKRTMRSFAIRSGTRLFCAAISWAFVGFQGLGDGGGTGFVASQIGVGGLLRVGRGGCSPHCFEHLAHGLAFSKARYAETWSLERARLGGGLVVTLMALIQRSDHWRLSSWSRRRRVWAAERAGSSKGPTTTAQAINSRRRVASQSVDMPKPRSIRKRGSACLRLGARGNPVIQTR
jgi:hypothetical protein